MKIKMITAFLIITSLYSSFSYGSSKTKRCCDGERLSYILSSLFQRTDYASLAYANEPQLLQMKLKFKENIEDVDSYYLSHGYTLTSFTSCTDIPVFLTPLHESVERGNIDCVRLLLQAGADVHKKIKTDTTYNERAEEDFLGCAWLNEFVKTDKKLKKSTKEIYERNNIDLSALALAKRLIGKRNDIVKKYRRIDIYELLREHSKKKN